MQMKTSSVRDSKDDNRRKFHEEIKITSLKIPMKSFLFQMLLKEQIRKNLWKIL